MKSKFLSSHHPPRFPAVGRDIPEGKKLEQTKDELISVVSHELRSPLAVIRECVSQMLEGLLGPISELQRRSLNIALRNSDRLAHIIGDLLDMSQIEARTVQLQIEAVALADLVQSIAAGFEIPFKEKGLSLRINAVDGGGPVSADRHKITQVITHLLENALKFTTRGAVEISVVEKNGVVECSVSDTGRGIAPEDLSRVFERFNQFDRIEGGGRRGTGLGLAICKGIVDLHHGKIWVQSEPDKGSVFTFSLPSRMGSIL